LNSSRDQRSTGIFLPYGITLFLTGFSLAAFLAVIVIGLVLDSWPVIMIGSVLAALFIANCIFIVRTGRERWAARRARPGNN
jgi:hypothetical protein